MTRTIPSPTTRRRVAKVNTQPKESKDYSAYVPVTLGTLKTAAYIDSGNTFANVISPKTMAAWESTKTSWSQYRSCPSVPQPRGKP